MNFGKIILLGIEIKLKYMNLFLFCINLKICLINLQQLIYFYFFVFFNYLRYIVNDSCNFRCQYFYKDYYYCRVEGCLVLFKLKDGVREYVRQVFELYYY